MSDKIYGNFVRPSSSEPRIIESPSISGEEVRRLYLAEVKEVKDPEPATEDYPRTSERRNKHAVDYSELSDKDIFLSAQNNDVTKLKFLLDKSPDKLNIVDNYGWSLLMIACQANSVEAARELLKRDIDVSIRDRAGNSARSLVIKNRNLILADLLLSHKSKSHSEEISKKGCKKVKLKEEYLCEICNKTYPDKQQHLSSTVHNINASKGRKIPTNYVIPQSNIGYQIMLKKGWDKEEGLGPDGTGKKYPIRTVQKKDRKGLGHGKIRESVKKENETVRHFNRRILARDYQNNRKLEIDFRRQFY